MRYNKIMIPKRAKPKGEGESPPVQGSELRFNPCTVEGVRASMNEEKRHGRAPTSGRAAAAPAHDGALGETRPIIPTLTENEPKDGYELRFREKPVDHILSALNRNGWHWHRRGKYWYIKRSAVAKQFAELLVGVPVPATKVPVVAMPVPVTNVNGNVPVPPNVITVNFTPARPRWQDRFRKA